MKLYGKSLFVFRRDLRLADNTGLLEALKQSESVTTCFIVDPRQVDENPYRSDNAIQFMVESLRELEQELVQRGGHLNVLYGQADDILEKLLSGKSRYDALFVNRDYTPFSLKRDQQMAVVCKRHNVIFHAYHDALLAEPGSVMTKAGTPYTKYTPFLRTACKIIINKPKLAAATGYDPVHLAGALPVERSMHKLLGKPNDALFEHGGSVQAQVILKNIRSFKDYEALRNQPAVAGTTGLSAHLKFGTVSIRQVYHAIVQRLGSDHALIKELWWRDFFTHILYHFPHVLGHSFYAQYDHLEWQTKHFKAWCEGMTGFPLVDAGMRQLNATGWMHNRVRMVVASFLTKDLHIDWRKGEKYFAQKLVDYDPAVNNGNWQWAASTGCDAQPYFRIFNPWLQQKKFDPACAYIKQWVPELAHLTARQIHKLATDHPVGLEYPRPLINHAEQAASTKTMMRAVQRFSRTSKP